MINLDGKVPEQSVLFIYYIVCFICILLRLYSLISVNFENLQENDLAEAGVSREVTMDCSHLFKWEQECNMIKIIIPNVCVKVVL